MDATEPHMYAGMHSVGGAAGQLSRVHKHKVQFRERSEERLLAGQGGSPARYVPMSFNFPHPGPVEKTKGETCAQSPTTRS